MIVKEEPNFEKMNEEMYNLFIDLLKFEFNKISFINSAKFYFHQHGLESYKNFFEQMRNNCCDFKEDLTMHLLNRSADIPEMTIPAMNFDFEDSVDVFKQFAAFEDKAYKKLEAVGIKALEIKDIKSLAFIVGKNNKNDHIACRALEAVRNEQDPNKLISCFASNIPW